MTSFYLHVFGIPACLIGGFACGVVVHAKVMPLVQRFRDAWAVVTK